MVEAGYDGPAPKAEPRQLTFAPWHPYHVSWSPDGTSLALTYNARFSSLVDEEQQIALVDVATGETETITPADRHSSMAAFSPDGRQLAYFTDRETDYRAYLNLKDLVVRDLESGETVVVTPGHNLTLAGYGSTPAEAPWWAANSRVIYLRAADETDLDVYMVDTHKQVMVPITDLDGSAMAMDYAGGTLVTMESALDHPGRLLVGEPNRKMKELTSLQDQIRDFDLKPARKLRLPGHEGGFVDGYLFLPPGAGDQDKLPAIVEMHGGPYSRYGNAWTSRYPWQVLSHDGFAVLIVNPRGGTGYGADFLRGVYRNFGTDDFQDIMAAVDEMVARGTFDPQRHGLHRLQLRRPQ